MRLPKYFTAFIALCLVSLFADITYEGCRSVLGAYFEVLGATAVIAGSISAGEFLSYIVRGVSGFIAGTLKSSLTYWLLIFAGYALNLVAVPLLALAGNWPLALALVMAERVGKGLRTPARDVVLAEVTEGMGRGKGFGLHELMDQVGAVSGPAIVMLALKHTGNYSFTYAILAVPALAALATLTVAYRSYPSVKAVEPGQHHTEELGLYFWLFTASVALLSLGYIHWGLAAYHMRTSSVIPDYMVAVMYLVAMLADAAVAYPAGYLYDRVGPKTILATPVLAAMTAPALLLARSSWDLIVASAIWGVVMGIYETNMRVVVADVVPPSRRAHAYGIYGLVFGGSWTLGNIIIGYLYTVSVNYAVAYVAVTEAVALAVVLLFTLKFKSPGLLNRSQSTGSVTNQT
ncbi:MAG: MFS transporter [Desulfurococcales archaeon]|nr:MFS transporter [Desulfurococcales archaeon]